jgi:hypothetical protein
MLLISTITVSPSGWNIKQETRHTAKHVPLQDVPFIACLNTVALSHWKRTSVGTCCEIYRPPRHYKGDILYNLNISLDLNLHLHQRECLRVQGDVPLYDVARLRQCFG